MKNGIKSVLRSPVKTLLFLILLTIATVFMSIGVGMYSSADNMLKQADEVFTTAGELTYTGGFYPDDKYHDEMLINAQKEFDISSLANIGGVTLAEENIRLRATADNYIPVKSVMPYREISVFIATVDGTSIYHEGVFSGKVHNYLYSQNSSDGNNIYFFPSENANSEYEIGHVYIATGSFEYLYSAKAFYPQSYTKALNLDFEYPYIADISEYYPDNMDKFWESETGRQYIYFIELVKIINESVNIVATKKIEAVDSFQRMEYTILEGSFFSSEDYLYGNKCIVPLAIQTKTGLGVGDKISLNIHYPANEGGIYNSFKPEIGYASYEEFEIIGIYQSPTYEVPIYIANSGQEWLRRSENDYSLGRIVIENSKREKVEDYIRTADILPADVRLNIYDQGYGQAVIPILGMMETATLVITVCALFCLLIIMFFAFFFVYRSGKTVTTLMNLGTGYGGTLLFLLSGCAVISIFSSAIGCTAGYFLSDNINQIVFEAAQNNLDFDLRFSYTGAGVNSDIFSPLVETQGFVYVAFGAALFAFTVFVCLLFSHQTIKKQNPVYKFKYKLKQLVKREKQTFEPKGLTRLKFVDYLPFSSFRYSVKSLLRGSSRSMVIPIVFLCGVVFINIFFTIKTQYENKLDTVYTDVPVTVQMTDSKGRLIDNIITYSGFVSQIKSSGYVSDYWYSYNIRYDYNGRVIHADNTADHTPLNETPIPDGWGQYTKFVENIDKNFEKLVGTNNLAKAPEFYYSKNPVEITFAEGYALTVPKGENPRQNIQYSNALTSSYRREGDVIKAYGYVSTAFLEEHGLLLNDVIRITSLEVYSNMSLRTEKIDLTIAGTYKKESAMENLYILAPLFSTYTIHSAGFQVKDSKNISDFKDWLSENYSQVNEFGENRRWIIVDDLDLYRTIQSIERYISYINITYPLILLLTLGTGFFAANTLMKGRLWEIAVMQGVGNSRISIFSSFLIEQILLSIPGIAAGMLISRFALNITINAANMSIFILCYYVGTSTAIVQAQSAKTIKSLKEKED